MNLFGWNVSKSIDRVVQTTGSVVKGWVDVKNWYKPNWWQLGEDGPNSTVALRSSTVYACVATLAQEVARLKISHYSNKDLMGREEMYRSDITRLLTNPNSYLNRSDFFLQLMYSILMDGNGYALAVRDNRNRISSLTPLNPGAVQPYVVPGTSEIYYSVAQIDIDPMENFDPTTFIPQRNMLHIRLFTPVHPLMGVTPLTACMMSVTNGLAIQEDSTKFFSNESKPSGILRTPKPLNPEQAKRLREAWGAGTTGDNAGKVPVLDNDLSFQQMSLSAADAQLIEQYSMTKKDIAIAFRIPLYMVGEGDHQFSTAEASQRDFITRSLGFYIEHIEAGLDSFFGLDGRTEGIEFDVEQGIMRPEFNARIDGLTKGVQGGVYTPNEAREAEFLPPIEAGDNLFMQRQNVPIDMLGEDVIAMGGAEDSSDDSSDSDDDEPEDDSEDKGISPEKLRLLLNLPRTA